MAKTKRPSLGDGATFGGVPLKLIWKVELVVSGASESVASSLY